MKKLLVASLGLMLFACGSPDTEVAEQKADTLAVDSAALKADEEKEFKLHMIVANIPAPSHEIIAIGKAGYNYDGSLVLDKAKAGTYPTEFKKGVTYGMYSADLAYAASFNKSNDLLALFAATRKAAESANCAKIFDDVTKSAHFEDFQRNPDSLSAILERVYVTTESFLESDKHMDIATRVLVGAWVEGQYLLLSSIDGQKSKKDLDLKTKVWEAKIHLNNIIELLKEYPEDQDIAPTTAMLVDYMKDYEGVSAADQFIKEKISKMLADIKAIRTKLAE